MLAAVVMAMAGTLSTATLMEPADSEEAVCSNGASRPAGASAVASCNGDAAPSGAGGGAGDGAVGRRSSAKGSAGRAMLQVGRGDNKPFSAITTQSRVLVTSDLSSLHESHYLAFNHQMPVAYNAHKAFGYFMETTHLGKDLSAQESEAFESRFVREVEERSGEDPRAVIGDDSEREGVWKQIVGQVLEDQKPVATGHVVEVLNVADLGWNAVLEDWLTNTSALDVRRTCGAMVSPEAAERIILERKNADLGLIDLDEGAEELGELEFDTREHWPNCAMTIGHVRDQGQCGDCWAMAAATVIEGRLCISTNGSFSGPSAYISAGYIASCGNAARDGCTGGFVDRALRWAAHEGVPTGGRGSRVTTCVPYFASGDSLDHFFAASHKSPPCPKACTDKLYPRSLADDLFQPEGMVFTVTTASFTLARRALLMEGPIAIGIKVYSDFMTYKSGIYRKSPSAQYMGLHATGAIGFGPDYILGVNSWDTRWGDGGRFKIHKSQVMLYWLPGAIAGTGPGYPYPVPGGPELPTEAMCHHDGWMRSPLDMAGQSVTTEAGALACQARCARTAGCAYFSFWHDGAHHGECHLQDEKAVSIETPNVVTGPARCPSAANTSSTTTRTTTTDESDCWRPPSQCVPAFTYKGKMYEGCTVDDFMGTGWCAHDVEYARGRWSQCLWNCAPRTTTTTTSTTTSTTTIPCWRPRDVCAPRFEYRGVNYTECTTRDNKGRGWCAHNASFELREWSECLPCNQDMIAELFPEDGVKSGSTSIPWSLWPLWTLIIRALG